MCRQRLRLEYHNFENSEEKNIHNVDIFVRGVLELTKPMMIAKVL